MSRSDSVFFMAYNTSSLRLLCLLMLASLFLFHSTAMGQSLRKGRIIAAGNGIEVRQSDVEELKSFYAKQNFHSSEREYQKAAVRYALFAREARSLGLDKRLQKETNSTVRATSLDSAATKKKLFDLYLRHVMKDTSMSGDVIESYYLAHPDKFQVEGNATQVKPLTDELKESIKFKILSAKKKIIVRSEFERLKSKYKVETRYE